MDLKKIISILYDMELNNFYMTNAIIVLDEEINRLGRKNKQAGVKNVSIAEEEFKEKKPQREKFKHFSIVSKCSEIVLLIAGIFGMIKSFIDVFEEFRLLDIITIIPTFLLYLIGFSLAGGLVGAIIGAIIEIFMLVVREISYRFELSAYNDKHKSFNEKKVQKIKDDEERVKKEIKSDKIRIEKELTKKKILVEKVALIKGRKQSAENVLKKLYTKTGIDPKFQNLMAMGYMNEFARLGIATRLEGVDGLYYLILKELRWDQMQQSLTTICNKLDTMIDSQRMMYGELVSMRQESKMMANRVINGINNLSGDIGELKKVAELTGERVGKGINSLNSNINGLKAIEEYNSRRITKELEYMNYMTKYGI